MHNEISVHITSIGVCNVQLTEIIIVFPSNKWVSLTRELVDVLCVWSSIWQAASATFAFTT